MDDIRQGPSSVDAAGSIDSAHLRELGYDQTLKREFGFWHAAAIGFADISPIVAMYGMFALALAASGPTMFWGLFLVLGGMTMVALVFGEISSHWPLAGGVYQWTRQQVGTNWAWFGGWAYMWTMVLAMTTCSYAAASYVAAALGWEPSKPVLIGLAIGGSIARKGQIAVSSASLPVASPLFIATVVFVIIIMSALTFFPVMALGPILEHLLMLAGRTF